MRVERKRGKEKLRAIWRFEAWASRRPEIRLWVKGRCWGRAWYFITWTEHGWTDFWIFSSKDLPNAMNAAEITDKLGLHSLRQRNWYIQTTCATSGDGLYEGLDWLSNQLKNQKWREVPRSPCVVAKSAGLLCVRVCVWGAECGCVAGVGAAFSHSALYTL